jgi:hypothetical protein
MALKPAGIAMLVLATGPAAGAADIAGAWQIHGSVFFNAVDTICHFKTDGAGVVGTCEVDGAPGAYTPVTLSDRGVTWSWNPGPAVLTFEATLTSDTTMKGAIKVRGFTGSFTGTKQ